MATPLCHGGASTVPRRPRQRETVATTRCHGGDTTVPRWPRHGPTVATPRRHGGHATLPRRRHHGATVAMAWCHGGRGTVPPWPRQGATVATARCQWRRHGATVARSPGPGSWAPGPGLWPPALGPGPKVPVPGSGRLTLSLVGRLGAGGGGGCLVGISGPSAGPCVTLVASAEIAVRLVTRFAVLFTVYMLWQQFPTYVGSFRVGGNGF